MEAPVAKPSDVASFRERLFFDESHGAILDRERRYVLLRGDALMGVFRRLSPSAREEAFAALEASIFEHGSDSARAYRAMGQGDGAELAHAVAAAAPQLGWGVWTFDIEPDRLRLTVANSPFAAAYGAADAPVCHAIVGMVRGVAGLVFERPAVAREIACAAMGAPHCLFEAEPT
jgi:predicted hydrocarbon binding protein